MCTSQRADLLPNVYSGIVAFIVGALLWTIIIGLGYRKVVSRDMKERERLNELSKSFGTMELKIDDDQSDEESEEEGEENLNYG